MSEIVDAKLVQITIRLGNNPRFEIHADERVTINPPSARYHRKGAGDEWKELLGDVLAKLRAAYPDGTSISLTVDDDAIIAEA